MYDKKTRRRAKRGSDREIQKGERQLMVAETRVDEKEEEAAEVRKNE